MEGGGRGVLGFEQWCPNETARPRQLIWGEGGGGGGGDSQEGRADKQQGGARWGGRGQRDEDWFSGGGGGCPTLHLDTPFRLRSVGRGAAVGWVRVSVCVGGGGCPLCSRGRVQGPVYHPDGGEGGATCVHLPHRAAPPPSDSYRERLPHVWHTHIRTVCFPCDLERPVSPACFTSLPSGSLIGPHLPQLVLPACLTSASGQALGLQPCSRLRHSRSL